jgi:hypothetical protein
MRRVPLRWRLFVVVVAAVVPLAITAAYSLFAGYDAQRQQAEASGLDVARAFDTAVGAELKRTISVLQVPGANPPRSTASTPISSSSARARALQLEPNWKAISLADSQGRPLLDTRQLADGSAPPPIADPESMGNRASHRKARGRLSREGRLGICARGARADLRDGRPIVRDHGDARSERDPRGAQYADRRRPLDRGGGGCAREPVARTKSAEQSIGTPFSPRSSRC